MPLSRVMGDAVEDPEFASQDGAALDAGDRRLRAAGFASRSAFLTSPTAGGSSWLAHATLLSGLWIDNQQRYDDLAPATAGPLPAPSAGRAGARSASWSRKCHPRATSLGNPLGTSKANSGVGSSARPALAKRLQHGCRPRAGGFPAKVDVSRQRDIRMAELISRCS